MDKNYEKEMNAEEGVAVSVTTGMPSGTVWNDERLL